MSGNIEIKPFTFLDPSLTFVDRLANAHNYVSDPKFGGELEVMALLKGPDGSYEPVGYAGAQGMAAFLDRLLADGTFRIDKLVDGQPVRLVSQSGEVICFENYAAVIERADKAYDMKDGSPEDGLIRFAHSIDRFAETIAAFSKASNFCLSPFDYDVFCAEHTFEGKHAPSERFGEGGLLGLYDDTHPLVKEIDMRTTSSHFSVGYRSKEHLWRQIRVMNMLTPPLYAAFAGSPPTMEVELNGLRTILPKTAAQAHVKAGSDIHIIQQLLVPRARIWSLSDRERTGIDRTIVTHLFNEKASFGDYLQAVVNKDVIFYDEHVAQHSFESAFHQATVTGCVMTDYMKHVGTLWYDIRVDLMRLEARMAGSAPWKSKALAALMTGILLDEEALATVEDVLNGLSLNAEALVHMREDVAVQGMKAPMGNGGDTAGSVLAAIIDIAEKHQPVAVRPLLVPLKTVVETGMSDSDYLREIEAVVGSDYTGFLHLDYDGLEPFIVMHEKGMLNHILRKEDASPCTSRVQPASWATKLQP